LATSSLADQRTRVLKQGEAFGVFDAYGNIHPKGNGTHGLFHGSTRYLSHFELRLDNVRPLLLSSTVRNDNLSLTVDLMNREGYDGGGDSHLMPGTVHLFRTKFLWQDTCYERIEITNYGPKAVDITLSVHFNADFKDIFEIRGMARDQRGRQLDPVLGEGVVYLRYEGLDNVVRSTRLEFAPAPSHLSGTEAVFRITSIPREMTSLYLNVACGPDRENNDNRRERFSRAYAAMLRRHREQVDQDCAIETSHELFNAWIDRSQSDLHMMLTDTPQGPYPYAGVPLFSTIFGRDGLITALQMLWVNPEIARGVLSYLSSTQAIANIPEQDAEPGKILHEVRKGEMVALGEVPFERYYGSADATPLFIILAAEYYARTGDLAFLKQIWPHVRSGLRWIDEMGDVDGDGFVEYVRRSPRGLTNQGWKDSWDSVFHADGSLAEGPIALCEIQAYVYRARLKAAQLAQVLGEPDVAADLILKAATLKENFERVFWLEDLETYALALDGMKRPCRVRSSNAGHALYGGIADSERARKLVKGLMSESSFSGWGIRTIPTGEARYNPMSYHNGSVWPHDNSIIAAGFAEYGHKREVVQLLTALFDCSHSLDLLRMPELFCGLARRREEGPTLYPVACAPQAWAAGTVFWLLQVSLGLTISGDTPEIKFRTPMLPNFLDEVTLRNVRAGTASADLLLKRQDGDVAVTLLRRQGDMNIIVVK